MFCGNAATKNSYRSERKKRVFLCFEILLQIIPEFQSFDVVNSLGKEGIPIKDSYENDNVFFMTISPCKNYLSDRTDLKEKCKSKRKFYYKNACVLFIKK